MNELIVTFAIKIDENTEIKVPYHKGDNPWLMAKKFCQQNNISYTLIPELEKQFKKEINNTLYTRHSNTDSKIHRTTNNTFISNNGQPEEYKQKVYDRLTRTKRADTHL